MNRPIPIQTSQEPIERREGLTLALCLCLFVVVVFAGGCGWPAVERDGEEEARALVWGAFAEEFPVDFHPSPPAVRWEEGEPCPWDPGVMTLTWKHCYFGVYMPGSDNVYLLLVPGEPLWRSGYVHEMMHAWLVKTRGDGDANHASPVWNTTVPAVQKLLAVHGL